MVPVNVKHHLYLLPHTPSLTSLVDSLDVKHHVYLLTSLKSPSPVNRMVSLDVKHHVYLLTSLTSPSPVNRMVSLDVKHHVYLLISFTFPSLRSLMVSVDVQHHVFLLKSCESLRVWHSCGESGGGRCTKAINNINNNNSERVLPGCHKPFVRLVTWTAGSHW